MGFDSDIGMAPVYDIPLTFVLGCWHFATDTSFDFTRRTFLGLLHIPTFIGVSPNNTYIYVDMFIFCIIGRVEAVVYWISRVVGGRIVRVLNQQSLYPLKISQIKYLIMMTTMMIWRWMM